MRGRLALTVVAVWCIGLIAGAVPATAAKPAAPAIAAKPAAPATAAKPPAPQPCVSNPAAVVARPPTPESAFAELPPELSSKLDGAIEGAVKATAAPGAIAGVRTPEGTWTKAYGLADTATGEPIATGMHLRIGSVTKTFTGTVILQLAGEGRLTLGDPIGKYYKAIPNGDRITLEQLVNMTSGIAGYYSDAFLQRYFANPAAAFTPDELIAQGLSASPIFEPGQMFNYSHTNTILLGKVIEAVTGQPVETAFQQRIYAPLELTGTSLPHASAEIPSPHPQGYTSQGTGQPVNATAWSPSFGWTAGAMISDLEDLLTYTRALGTGQGLLSPAAQILRLQSMQPLSGYGWALHCVGGWVGHTGKLPGFNTTAYYDTTTDTSVVVMVNSDIPSGNCPEPPTLTDRVVQLACASPATQVFTALSETLGHKFDPR
jgi:D-alanyl-D-alanine carboxypeptidase